MCVAFAGAVLLFPDIFALHIGAMATRHFLMLAIMTAVGLAVLILGSFAVRPLLKKAEDGTLPRLDLKKLKLNNASEIMKGRHGK
jgi:hypothetical protein